MTIEFRDVEGRGSSGMCLAEFTERSFREMTKACRIDPEVLRGEPQKSFSRHQNYIQEQVSRFGNDD